jgi:hypothetical protein
MAEIYDIEDYRHRNRQPTEPLSDMPDDFILHACIEFIEKRGYKYLTITRETKPTRKDKGKTVFYEFGDLVS